MTFEEYIDCEFARNLELAREEANIDLLDPDDDVECRAWRYATEWTQEAIATDVAAYFDKKWAERQEGINKVFYD